MISGRVFNISRYAVHDGPGIRVTVFMQGCPLACWWCHNPESRPTQGGREMSAAEVMGVVDQDRLFIDESGGGVTFSGGEPLSQPEFLATMLTECRKRELHAAVDTAGYGDPTFLRSIADNVDLFLFDLKIMDDGEHLKYVGASNRLILDNLRLLAKLGTRVAIRLPVVPGITDGAGNLGAIADFAAQLRLREVHLLAYHHYAAAKYRRMKLRNPMPRTQPPSAQRMNELQQYFQSRGFVAKVGG